VRLHVSQIGEIDVAFNGVGDRPFSAVDAILAKASQDEREIGFLLVGHDRHDLGKLKFLESFTDSEFLGLGLQAALAQALEEESGKRLDIGDVPDRAQRPGWPSLRG
jgi:hypothetical protein